MTRIPRRLPAFRSPPGLLLLLLMLCAPSALRAQVRDTLAARQDTTVTDSAVPPPQLVRLGRTAAPQRSAGVWRWDRDALAASGALSLIELLNQVPGVVTLRAGMFLQPEAASAFGGTSPRLQLELDGIVLDPLTAAAFDLAALELVEVDEVVVERRLDLLRISVRTLEPEDARPYSRVEAAVGQPDANLFRGVFLAPRVLVGPLGFAIERLDTDGVGGREPADVFTGWVKWGWLGEHRGLQLEFRRSSLDREPRSPWPQTRKRQDLILRLRNRFAEGVVAEAYMARSAAEVEEIDTLLVPDEEPPEPLERSSVQTGVRASASGGNGWVEAALHTNNEDALPRWSADVSGGIAFPRVATVRGNAAHASWRDVGSTLSVSLRAESAPLLGMTPFAEWTTGERGAPTWLPDPDSSTFVDDRSGYRLGAEAVLRGIFAGGALVHLETDSVPAFGLPFDSAGRRFAGGSVTGWEAYGRLPLFVSWLAAEGAYLRWTSGTRWVYLPADTWRAALVLHALPLPSGNLEIIGRVEAAHRGTLLAPAAPAPGEPLALVGVPARTVVNAYLQIRILDVRIFFRSDDMVGNDIEDLPGRPIRGPRILYGVRWQFWN